MGVDLTLLIVDGYINDENAFSHTVMEFTRNRDIHDLLNKKAFFKPILLSTYLALFPDGHRGYGIITDTPYGEKIKYICAKDFVEVMKEYQEPLSKEIKACVAYVKELSPYKYIGLYYH